MGWRKGEGIRAVQLCKQIKLINREERGRATSECSFFSSLFSALLIREKEREGASFPA